VSVTGTVQGLPATSEAELGADVELARQFTALYERYVDFVWRSVRLLGVVPEMVDDAVQDVFLVAHRRFADFEARSTPKTWLFAIALRVVHDHRRSRRRRMRLLEQAKRVERSPSRTPFDDVAGAQARATLLAALQRLPEEQRAVFMLTELEEMSAPEIAAALGVNLNTVYSRLRAARRDVADVLRSLSRGGAR
jgi:RNA polymerase sigma-70 factor, ECF subfamily